MTSSILLTDEHLQNFVREGYVIVDADLPAEFHADVRGQIQRVFDTDGNPGNDILPRVPDLHRVLEQPTVAGALSSLLGYDYLLHPHRHCHLNPAGSPGQQMHQDSYERDQNVRHHRPRWLMAFYYPQDVDSKTGPSSIVPATQFLTWKSQHDSPRELPLVGKAGTVVIIHYDLWHRAMANVGAADRFMVKFLFTRMREPSDASWDHDGRDWPTSGVVGDAVCAHQWDWLRGATRRSVVAGPPLEVLAPRLQEEDELMRYDAAYQLAHNGSEGISLLIDALRSEGVHRLESNLERSHTNPAQLDAAFGLSAAGIDAVAPVVDLLDEEQWWLRASAADILGDMGHVAAPTVDALVAATADDSEWVRRNAVEALGNIGPAASSAIPLLSQRLTDPDVPVRHNAALSLGKVGGGPVDALTAACDDEDHYVRELSAVALARGTQ